MQFFSKTHIIMSMLAVVAYFFATNTVLADDPGKIFIPHQVQEYPGSIRRAEGDRNTLLSKDKMPAILAYYQKYKIHGDRIEQFEDDWSTGFQVIYTENIDGKQQSAVLLTVRQKKATERMHPALGELFMQTKFGRHSEQEFRLVEKQYAQVSTAFYRLVDDGNGKYISEGDLIYKKTYASVYGKGQMQKPDNETSQMKNSTRDIRQQAQEMKARGDMAGLAQLAQQSRAHSGQTQEGASAMDMATKDTWNTWLKCLQDLDATAYRTQISLR